MALTANTDGWGNKLVTVFASTLDSFILTRNISSIYLNRDSGSGQISAKETNKSFAGICKNCAMVACRPDNFSAKVLGLLPAADATNVYYHNRRAVIANATPTLTEYYCV